MVDSTEFAEWMAYYQIEPFGEERADFREAMVPYMLASAFSKKGKKVKLEDFIVSNMLSNEPKAVQTRSQMLAALKGVAAKYDASKKRG